MLVVKKYILPLVTIISLLGIGVYYYQEKDLEQINQDSQFSDTVEELSKIWMSGESKQVIAKKCQQIESNYRRCNPDFLYCLAKNNFKINGHSISFPLLKNKKLPYQIINGRFLWISLDHKFKSTELLLEKSCHEILLDEGEYALGPQIKKDFVWSNYKRKIYLDKSQVLNRDITEWLQQINSPLYEENRKLKQYSIAGQLLPEQMEKYCNYKEGQVAMAHILDAAFFYKSYDQGDRVFHRGPYPWQIKGRKTFLDSLNKKDFKLTKTHCKKIAGSECQSLISEAELYRSSPTWSGVFQALGGYMEYTRNPLRPRRNLNASSFYFPIKSAWHQIGRRAFWDGKGHGFSNFTFYREDPKVKVEKFDVAFRCMRSRYE